MWLWRRMEGIKWTDKVRNEEVLRRVGEQRSLLKAIRKRKRNWLGHILRRDCLQRRVMEGKIEGEREREQILSAVIAVLWWFEESFRRRVSPSLGLFLWGNTGASF
uniref:Uncharacterized protein n=1 Tax=Cacopsylla melanoneura TaxID=428564 RepID=A0A8D9A6H6_9HEMI